MHRRRLQQQYESLSRKQTHGAWLHCYQACCQQQDLRCAAGAVSDRIQSQNCTSNSNSIPQVDHGRRLFTSVYRQTQHKRGSRGEKANTAACACSGGSAYKHHTHQTQCPTPCGCVHIVCAHSRTVARRSCCARCNICMQSVNTTSFPSIRNLPLAPSADGYFANRRLFARLASTQPDPTIRHKD